MHCIDISHDIYAMHYLIMRKSAPCDILLSAFHPIMVKQVLHCMESAIFAINPWSPEIAYLFFIAI